MRRTAQKSPASARAYASDCRLFVAWCGVHNLISLPATPETVVKFLTEQAAAGFKWGTVVRRQCAIRDMHLLVTLEPPTNAEIVREAMLQLRAKYWRRPIKKLPITPYIIRRVVARAPDTLATARLKALLGLGYETALRRSELMKLKTSAFEAHKQGLRWRRNNRIVRDRKGLTPVRWYLEWLQKSGTESGVIFRAMNKAGKVLNRALDGKQAANLLKEALARAGYNPSRYSLESMRRGHVVTEARKGTPNSVLKQIARYRYTASVDAALDGEDFRYAKKVP